MLVGLYFHKLEKENYETNFLQVYIFTRNKCGFMFSRFYNFLGDTKKYKPGTLGTKSCQMFNIEAERFWNFETGFVRFGGYF